MATSHSLYETAGVIEKYDNLKNVGFGLNQKMDMTTFKFWKSLTEEGCLSVKCSHYCLLYW